MSNHVIVRGGLPVHRRVLAAACLGAAGTMAVLIGSLGVAAASAHGRDHGRGYHRSHAAVRGVRQHQRSWHHHRAAAAGIVQGAPSGESFTIETHGGTTDTVEVSTSTTYTEFGVSSPTLSNVESGDHVVVFGTASGPMVTATHVLIGGNCLGGGPDHFGGSWGGS